MSKATNAFLGPDQFHGCAGSSSPYLIKREAFSKACLEMLRYVDRELYQSTRIVPGGPVLGASCGESLLGTPPASRASSF